MKKFIAEIGYNYYLVPQEMLAELLSIANSCTRLEYAGYQNFTMHEKDEPFCIKIELADVEK